MTARTEGFIVCHQWKYLCLSVFHKANATITLDGLRRIVQNLSGLFTRPNTGSNSPEVAIDRRIRKNNNFQTFSYLKCSTMF